MTNNAAVSNTTTDNANWYRKGLVENPSNSPFAIRVRHLWHRFGTRPVLKDVSFEVPHGHIFGFIGPNGAGKTTAIRVIATLYEPMAGVVEVDGYDVAVDSDIVRRVIGYMPDHAGVYERITVREYLEFFADAYQVDTPGTVQTVMELTDLTQIENRLVVQMSKGMKQRLQLARVLLHDPKILLLDEPASDLDPRARIEMRDLLLELRALGKTIMLSSHILSELADVCTSIAIMERGSIVVSGPIDEISYRLEKQRNSRLISTSSLLSQASINTPSAETNAIDNRLPQLPDPAVICDTVVGTNATTWPDQPSLTQTSNAMNAVSSEEAVSASSLHTATTEFSSHLYETPSANSSNATAEMLNNEADSTYLPNQVTYDTDRRRMEQATTPAGVPIPGTVIKRVKIRTLSAAPQAQLLLSGGPGILQVRCVSASMLIVDYEGTDAFIAKMVTRLVSNGVQIVGVEPERNELERIFLEVTEGSLQ